MSSGPDLCLFFCWPILLILQLSVSSVTVLLSWPQPFSVAGGLECQRTKPHIELWGQTLRRWERRTFYPGLLPGFQSTLLVSEYYKVSYKNDSFKPSPFLCRDSKPLPQGRCKHTHCAIPSPPVSVSHWICSFVPLSKAPMYINLGNDISGHCK